jgi:hypothetical protein
MLRRKQTEEEMLVIALAIFTSISLLCLVYFAIQIAFIGEQ